MVNKNTKIPSTGPLRSTTKNPQGMPKDILKQIDREGWTKTGQSNKFWKGTGEKTTKNPSFNIKGAKGSSGSPKLPGENLVKYDPNKKVASLTKPTGGALVKSPSSGLVKPPSTGGGLVKPPEGGKLTVYKPKPVDPITKIKLNYPKRGVHTGSSWVTRGYAKQFGAVNAIGSGITKYNQERAKGRSRLASATAGTLKGGTKGVGTYAGTIIGTKFGGKIGGLVGGTIGGAIGGRAYEIGKNISNVTKKTFKGFRKTPYNKTPEYKKLFKDNTKGETKLRIAS